jgi:hypothetical protein
MAEERLRAEAEELAKEPEMAEAEVVPTSQEEGEGPEVIVLPREETLGVSEALDPEESGAEHEPGAQDRESDI